MKCSRVAKLRGRNDETGNFVNFYGVRDAVRLRNNEKSKEKPEKSSNSASSKNQESSAIAKLLQSELGSIIIALILQECPFLIVRLVLILKFHKKSVIFYTVKNVAMLIFLLYRVRVLL